MNKFVKAFSLFLFVVVAVHAQEKIRDIIKPANLTAGIPDSMLISDMFYSENYNAKFLPNKNVSVTYDKPSGKIYFKPDMNFSGMTLVDFSLGKYTYSIPVTSRIQQKFKFTFKKKKKYIYVYI